MLFDPQNFNMGWDAGPRIDLVRHFDARLGFRVAVLRHRQLERQSKFCGAGMLNTLAPGANPLSKADFGYDSRLYNLEANIKLAVTPCIDLFAGFRWIQIDEDVTFQETSGGGPGSLSQTALNNMYGFQLGTEGRLFDHGGPFWLDAFGKAGIYDAHVEGNFSEAGAFGAAAATPPGPCRVRGRIGNQPALPIHAAPGGLRRLRFAVGRRRDAGADGTSTKSLSNNSVLYHGAVAGLELHW